MWFSVTFVFIKQRYVFQVILDVTVLMCAQKGAIDGPFQDPPTYRLLLRIWVPPSTGIPIYFWISPTVQPLHWCPHWTSLRSSSCCSMNDLCQDVNGPHVEVQKAYITSRSIGGAVRCVRKAQSTILGIADIRIS